jgi:hypothetical protein
MAKRISEIPLTVSIPQYGRAAFGIGESSSYAAALRGDFPVIEIGGKKRVPIRKALQQLAGDPATLDQLLNDFLGKLRSVA